ncbi:MAG: DUF1501 domain-containing protein [Gemmataceae bacterium]|nr:DUF1501 domain-containing protein [Gemmataceae bacterium]
MPLSKQDIKNPCPGPTRRGLLSLTAGALLPALSGLGLARAAGNSPKTRSVILVNLFGGPSHIDTFDMKPNAPKEVRGEFSSIASRVPGYRVCEYLPLLGSRMDRAAIIRTVSHPYNSHNPYSVLTGFTGGSDRENYYAKPSDHPSMSAVSQYLGMKRAGVPFHVVTPAFPGHSQGLRRAGPYGGYLGKQYDPLMTQCEPSFERKGSFYDPVLPMGQPMLGGLAQGGVTVERLGSRLQLHRGLDAARKSFEGGLAGRNWTRQQDQAFELLTSSRVATAVDLEKEPAPLRDRYGRNLYGSSLLAARRLAEAGVPFITVNWECSAEGHGGHWDMHNKNFSMLRFNLPVLDAMVSALLDDLQSRGLWDSVLVIVTGEMGRTPKVNGAAGRDHWPQCGFCLLFGSGIRQGMVHGTSDRQAAYPLDHPVSPGDLCATVYHLLGLDPEATMIDHLGRPIHVSHGGKPVAGVLS